MSPYRTVIIPHIDYQTCRACLKCAAAAKCRFRAIVRIERGEPPYVDVSRCGGCGDCVQHCVYEAIAMPLSS